MNSKSIIILTTIGMGISSCGSKKDLQTQNTDNANPLLSNWNTPHQVPPFHLIQNNHFKPAILQGIEEQQKEVLAIVKNTEKPSFQNTILALENAGKNLKRVTTVFYNLTSANTNDDLQNLSKELAPILSKHNDGIFMNNELFEKVVQVWNNKNEHAYTDQELKVLENTYKAFTRNGANLNETDKEALSQINSKLSLLSLQYGSNLLKETNSYKLLIKDLNELKGLSEELIEQAKHAAIADGQPDMYLFTLHNPSVIPFLQYADNRETREKIWNAYQNKANNNNEFDNKKIAIEIANLRLEKAKLLGFDTHADYALENTMAKTPENVNNLLNKLWEPAKNKANQELNDIKEFAKKDGITTVQPWDWRYYTEKIRLKKYNLSEDELKPYFSLENVTNGVFTVTKNLYGLTYKENKDIPVYHPEVKGYEVLDKDGSLLGILYMDFFPRESKRSGAWMTSYRTQYMDNDKRVIPVISIVCNFSKPTSSAPALFTTDEVLTYFHEFGHALHGLFSNVQFQSIAGTSVSRDFVELPSQVMENWALEPEVLKTYAKHVQTGEVIPDALINKIQETGTFDQGFQTAEYLAASLLDMDYHTIKEPITVDALTFEANAAKKMKLPKEIIPRYRSTYFSHIFSGGYSAGYYSYIWSGVLDTDAFEAFKETGNLFNQEKAKLFRENILEKGGSEDSMELYKKFRGFEPKPDALIKKRGL